MGLFEIGVFIYVTVAVFAIVMTYREQQRNGLTSPLFNAIGFVSCLVWPITVAAVVHSATRRPA